MQRVCCPLPETEIAGQRIGLAISLDVAWLLMQRGLTQAAPASQAAPFHSIQGTSDEPGPVDNSKVGVAELLIYSPSLLLWSIAQLELQVPLYHPDQLVDKMRQVVDFQLPVGKVKLTPQANRIEIRTVRFVGKLQELATNPTVPAGSDCKLNQALVVLSSHLTGIEPARIATWIGKRQIKESFWLALSRSVGHSTPVGISMKDLGGSANFGDYFVRLQNEKMASLKRLAYGASHEINNPLANIASRAQTLLRDEKDGDRRKTLAKINQQAFRAFEMIADMMLFAHPPQLVIVESDLKPILQTVLDELQVTATDQETEIELRCAESLVCPVDPIQIAVAIRAVIQNALESLQSGGKVLVKAEHGANVELLDIVVEDNGPGFRENELRYVFDPFFSGREAGRGLGFGLSKAWRIAEQHGGEIVVSNLSHGGALVRLRIPYRVPTIR